MSMIPKNFSFVPGLPQKTNLAESAKSFVVGAAFQGWNALGYPATRFAYHQAVRVVDTRDTTSVLFDPLRSRSLLPPDAPVIVSGAVDPAVFAGAKQTLNSSVIQSRLRRPEALKDYVHINDLIDLEITSEGDLVITAKSHRSGVDGQISMERLLSGATIRTLQYSSRAKAFLEAGDHESFSALAAMWGAHIVQDTGMRIVIKGFGNIDPAQKYIVAPTHCSTAEFGVEFLVAKLLGLQIGFIAKNEIFTNPLFRLLLGATMEQAKERFFALPRNDSEQAIGVIGNVEQRLLDPNNPFSQVMFPHMSRPDVVIDECGLRQDGDPYIKPKGLRDGAFFLSLNSGVSISPWTINGLNRVFPPESSVKNGGLRNLAILTNQNVEIIISPAIDPKGLHGDKLNPNDAKRMMQQLKDYADAEYRRHLKAAVLSVEDVAYLERQRRIEREMSIVVGSRKTKTSSMTELRNRIADGVLSAALERMPVVHSVDRHHRSVKTESRNAEQTGARSITQMYQESADAQDRANKLYNKCLQHLNSNPLTVQALDGFLRYQKDQMKVLRKLDDQIQTATTEVGGYPFTIQNSVYKNYVDIVDRFRDRLEEAALATGTTVDQIQLRMEARRHQQILGAEKVSIEIMKSKGYDVDALLVFAEASPTMPEPQLSSILHRVYDEQPESEFMIELTNLRREMSDGGRAQLKARIEFVKYVQQKIDSAPQLRANLLAEISLHRTLSATLLNDTEFSSVDWIEPRIDALRQHPYALGLAEHLLRQRKKYRATKLKKQHIEASRIQAEYHKLLSEFVLNHGHHFIDSIEAIESIPNEDVLNELEQRHHEMAQAHNQVAELGRRYMAAIAGKTTEFGIEQARVHRDLQIESVIEVIAGRAIEDMAKIIGQYDEWLNDAEFVRWGKDVIRGVVKIQPRDSAESRAEYLATAMASVGRFSRSSFDVKPFVESLVDLGIHVFNFHEAVEKYIVQSNKMMQADKDEKKGGVPNARDINRVREDMIRHVFEKVDLPVATLLKKRGLQQGAREPVAPMFATVAQNFREEKLSDKMTSLLGAAVLASITMPGILMLTAASNLGLSADIKDALFMNWANDVDNRLNRSTVVADDGNATLLRHWTAPLQVLKHSSWTDFSFIMSGLRFSNPERGESVRIRGSRILAKMDLSGKVPIIGPGIADLTIPVGNDPVQFVAAEDRAVQAMSYGDIPAEWTSDHRPGPRPAALFPEITMPVGDILNIHAPAEFSLNVAPQSQVVNFISRNLDMLMRTRGLSGQSQMMMLMAFQNSFHRFPKPDHVMRFFPQGASRNIVVEMIASDWLPTPDELGMDRKQWNESINHVLTWMIYKAAIQPENYLL